MTCTMTSKQNIPENELVGDVVGDQAQKIQNLQMQLALAKKDNELKDVLIELAKKDMKLLEMQVKYKDLETQLREKNWQDLKTKKKIYIRTFFKRFGKLLQKLDGDWEVKLQTFLKTNINLLNEWHFETIRDFEDIYWDLCNTLNNTAHPMFIETDGIEIPDSLFEKDELRILGFMWDVCKYPMDKFKILYNSKPNESVATLKKGFLQITEKETCVETD